MDKEDDSYLAPEFLALAHRGGSLLPSNLGIENTLAAFNNAAELGFRYLETDVHATSDGHLAAFHDADLSRVTDVPGRISQFTLAQLSTVRVGGREQIPTLDDLLEAFPDARFNLDIKADAATDLLVDAVKRHRAAHRVCVGSFAISRIHRFRRELPGVTTAASPFGAAGLAWGRWLLAASAGDVFQVPMQHQVAGVTTRLVTPRSVSAVHRSGRKIHVWTIDRPEVMHELIDWGVDGIVTDRPDLLRDVLQARGMWSTHIGT
ncbi:MAG: glycerophosphodiester phosphodiesterase [Arachnia sp.]